VSGRLPPNNHLYAHACLPAFTVIPRRSTGTSTGLISWPTTRSNGLGHPGLRLLKGVPDMRQGTGIQRATKVVKIRNLEHRRPVCGVDGTVVSRHGASGPRYRGHCRRMLRLSVPAHSEGRILEVVAAPGKGHPDRSLSASLVRREWSHGLQLA